MVDSKKVLLKLIDIVLVKLKANDFPVNEERKKWLSDYYNICDYFTK